MWSSFEINILCLKQDSDSNFQVLFSNNVKKLNSSKNNKQNKEKERKNKDKMMDDDDDDNKHFMMYKTMSQGYLCT
jgi:hypothetical protein